MDGLGFVPSLRDSTRFDIGNGMIRWGKPGNELSPNLMLRSRLEWSDSESFIASIHLEETTACFSFSLGMAQTLAVAVARACASPDLLPNLGDPATIDPAISSGDVWPFSLVFRDETRQRLAHQLFEMAVKFIVMHEQGHLLSGHLHNLNAQTPDSEYSENRAPDSSPSDASGFQYRLFEMQADTFAAQMLLGYRAVRRGESTWLDIGGTPKWLPVATVAISIVMAVLEQLDRRAGSVGDHRTHPYAGARLLNVLRYVMATRAEDIRLLNRVQNVEVFETRFTKEDNPLQEALAPLAVFGVEPITDADYKWFFSERAVESPAESVMAFEAVSLLRRVPDLRLRLAPHCVAALQSIQFPPNEPTIQADTLASGGLPGVLGRHFGHMTWSQFKVHLMEAVASSGAHIPWNLIGEKAFLTECLTRGAPWLQKTYPDLYAPSK